MQERRRYIRIPDKTEVSYKVVATKIPRDYMTRDISMGGIRFLAHNFIPKGSILNIKLKLSNPSSIFEALAKTVWVKEVPFSDQYEVGVQFIDIKSGDVSHLNGHIKIFLSQNPTRRQAL